MDFASCAIDLVAVLLLALGLKGLAKVRTARSANGLAALAMGLAVAGLLYPFNFTTTAGRLPRFTKETIIQIEANTAGNAGHTGYVSMVVFYTIDESIVA